MQVDSIDKMTKYAGPGTADSCPERTTSEEAAVDSMVVSPKRQTDHVKPEPMKHYKNRRNAGGYGIALTSVFGAFLVRWLLDSYLGEALPFAMFLIAVAITTWFGGIGASLLAIALGGLVSNWFFVQPRYEFALTDLVDQAGMVIYLTITLATVGFAQTWRWAWKRTELMAQDLQHKMRR